MRLYAYPISDHRPPTYTQTLIWGSVATISILCRPITNRACFASIDYMCVARIDGYIYINYYLKIKGGSIERTKIRSTLFAAHESIVGFFILHPYISV